MSYYSTYAPIAVSAAQQYGVPPNIFLWQIGQESSWNPNASNGSAYGLAQFEPATASQFGVNPANPVQSLYGAAQYDAQLYQGTGSWQQALTQYGTLANVPSSVQQGFLNASNQVPQSVASQYGLGTGGNGFLTWGSGTNSSTSINSGCSALDLPCIIKTYFGQIFTAGLGFVFVAGGLFLLSGNKTTTILTTLLQAK